MTEPLRVTLTIPTPQEGWRILRLVHEYGTPEDYERLREFIGDSLPREVEHMPVEELDLGVRTYNVIKRLEIHTVGHLVGYSEEELRRRSSLVTDATIGELRHMLQHRYGVGLAGDTQRQAPGPDEV